MAEKFSVKLVLAGIFFAMICCGMIDYVVHLEPNQCQMTYMFENPQYVPVKLAANVTKMYPDYSLHVYGEGARANSYEMEKFSGVPVLFIPGNAGSYKQVRSLGSVALKKAKKTKFDFFTVNLNEELSGLFGPSLVTQTQFVHECIKKIRTLYKDEKTVVLVGHSMGGIVARAVMAIPDFDKSSVNIILTLASPLSRPVLHTDAYMTNFFNAVNDFWERERHSSLRNVVLMSVSGGRNDVQVPATFAHTHLADISTTMSAVPACWLTTDHLAVVWCKQMVLAIVRALFESVDVVTNEISTDRNHILDVFNYHLIRKSSGKYFYLSNHEKSVMFGPDGVWTEAIHRQYTFDRPALREKTTLMIPIHPDDIMRQEMIVVASDLESKDWIFACRQLQADTKKCAEADNLSQIGTVIPGQGDEYVRKTLTLDIAELAESGYSHIVIVMNLSDDPVHVSYDMHKKGGRELATEAPRFMSSFTAHTILRNTPEKAISYTVHISGMTQPWQSHKFIVEAKETQCDASVIMAQLTMPWAQQNKFLHGESGALTAVVETDVAQPEEHVNSTVDVQLFLDPECSYSISVQSSLSGVFRRFAAFYGVYLIIYSASALLVTLSDQLKAMAVTGRCPSALSVIFDLTPLRVVPFVKLTGFALTFMAIKDDFAFLRTSGLEFGLLPIFLFLVSLPLTIVMAIILWVAVLACGTSAHSFAVKVLGRTIGASNIAAEVAISGISKVPIVVGVALISLAYSTCGALAMTIALVFYFILIFRQYEDYLEQLIIDSTGATSSATEEEKVKRREENLGKVHLHVTIWLLVFVSTIVMSPTLVTWGRGASRNLQLVTDPTLPPSVALLVGLCFVWQQSVPLSERAWYKGVAWLVHVMAVLTLLFSSLHIYRLPYIVAAAIIAIILHQNLAPYAPLPPPPEEAAAVTTGEEANETEEIEDSAQATKRD